MIKERNGESTSESSLAVASVRQLDKFAPALVAFQADLSPVGKSASNPFFKSKYAPLPEVRESLQPLLAKHKLALISFPTVLDSGKNGLHFYLIHESGQYLDGVWQLNPVKQDPQGEGSATTYARRYGDMAITGLVADDDDDGNAASQSAPAKPAKTEEPTDAVLARAKKAINEMLEAQGYDTSTAKLAFITRVLGHSTIDNLIEADLVGDQLDNEAQS